MKPTVFDHRHVVVDCAILHYIHLWNLLVPSATLLLTLIYDLTLVSRFAFKMVRGFSKIDSFLQRSQGFMHQLCY